MKRIGKWKKIGFHQGHTHIRLSCDWRMCILPITVDPSCTHDITTSGRLRTPQAAVDRSLYASAQLSYDWTHRIMVYQLLEQHTFPHEWAYRMTFSPPLGVFAPFIQEWTSLCFPNYWTPGHLSHILDPILSNFLLLRSAHP